MKGEIRINVKISEELRSKFKSACALKKKSITERISELIKKDVAGEIKG